MPGSKWRTSSLSFANGNCVEVAALHDHTVAVRDSKDPDGPVLVFTERAWMDWVLLQKRIGPGDTWRIGRLIPE